jgi:hypothetical protein
MGTTEVYEPSLTIKAFCKSEGISEPSYYKLKQMGLGPKEMRYPAMNMVRIAHADRIAWQQLIKDPPPEHAETVRVLKEKLLLKSRAAAALSVESPKHISKGVTKRRKPQQGEAVR